MAENPLVTLKQAFRIPDSVTIVPFIQVNPLKTDIPTKSEDFTINNSVSPDPGLYTSKLGTLVYANIEFMAGQYETEIQGVVNTFDSVICEAVLINVVQAKRIIRTEIQGRNGSVKEYIGLDDYEVTISGVIVGANYTRPVEEINNLKKIIDAPIAIDVACAYLQALGIDQIVINNCQWSQDAGSYAYQTFSISAYSDVPQELRIANV